MLGKGKRGRKSKRRENNREAGQEVMLWLPNPVPECGEGVGRHDPTASTPKIHPGVGREGLDLKGSSETRGSGMRGSCLAWRKTMRWLCASVSLLLSRI